MHTQSFSSVQHICTREELSLLRSLNTPQKIQTFVSAIPHNFEEDGDSCMSVREVLRVNRAHCIEAAIVAALALWANGEKPLIMDMSANDRDDDHIIAVFQRNGFWGAISKSNHAYLRYRDPVYRTLRELAMSYFHEYYNAKGEKTLRSYSRPLSLAKFPPEEWISGLDAWKVAEATCEIRHYDLLNGNSIARLRLVDEVELRTLQAEEHVSSKRHLT